MVGGERDSEGQFYRFGLQAGKLVEFPIVGCKETQPFLSLATQSLVLRKRRPPPFCEGRLLERRLY